jgi:O-antigen/teichoic acid export membrane protein
MSNTPDEPTDVAHTLGGRIVGSAVALMGRRVTIMVLSAIATASVARIVSPSGYGRLSAGIATWTLVLAASDFGFDLALGRDLAIHPTRSRALLRASYRVKAVWSAALALGLATLGLIEGIGTTHGAILVAFAPSVLLSALSPARSLFTARYLVPETVKIDLVVTAFQVIAMVGAAREWGPTGTAIAISAFVSLNYAAIAVRAERHAEGDASEEGVHREVMGAVIPLGIVGFMSKVYLTVDIVLLGWLVSSAPLGRYAAASKLLSVVFQIPGLIVAAGLPGFAALASRRDDLEALLARVWHLLAATMLPATAASAIFAKSIVSVALGHEYAESANLFRILLCAALIGTASNVLGTLLVVRKTVRPLIVQNTLAIALNVIGNLVLVPTYGVHAAAWLTVATELLVCTGSYLALRHDVALGSCVAVSIRPLVAIGAASIVALVLLWSPAVALVASALTFLVAMALLGGWPDEIRRLVGTRPVPAA